jgi:tetratricopeptide (TPR) repeat protein
LNQPEKSVQILEKSVKKHPNTELKLLLADQYVRISEFRKAIEMFDSAEVQLGITEEVSIQKHRIYQLLNETDKAAWEIKKLIKQFPYEPKYYFTLHDFYISESNETEAINVLKSLQNILPENPQNLLKLGDYYRTKRSDVERAYEYLSKAFTSQQLGADQKAAYLQKLNDKNEVDLQLKTRLTSVFMEAGGRHPAMYAMQAKTFEQNNQLDSARTYYLKALEINELNQDIWMDLIELDVKINNVSHLTRDCEKGLEVFPNDSRFLKSAGKAYFALHQYDKAIRYLEKIDKLGAATTDELTELYPYIGISWFYKSNQELAEKWFNKALENNPNHVSTLESYAFMLISLNQNMDKAKAMLEKAASIEENNPLILRTQALLKLQEKNYPEAILLAERALKANPQSIDLTEFMGDVWFKAGDKQKAMQYWKEAKQKGGSWESLLKKIKDGSL